MGLPDKQALTVFPFTRHGMVINAEPASTGDYYVGEILVLDSVQASTGGYFQNYQSGEALAMKVERHDSAEATYNGDKTFGIATMNEPINRPSLVDDRALLGLEDRTLIVTTTIAGSMRQLSLLVSDDMILMPLWDVVNNQDAVLTASDVGSTVYASKTDATDSHTGKDGAGTIDDQSGLTGGAAQAIGRVVGVPVSGGKWAYVHFKRVV